MIAPFTSRSGQLVSVLITALLLLIGSQALATVPAPTPGQEPAEVWGEWLRGGPDQGRDLPEPLGPFNYLREFVQMNDFLAIWQLLDPDSTDFGGMIEAESGYLGGVIQTDNTLEAIWCWSRYLEFSGQTTYNDNIDAAWVYCTRYPAWQEEGGVGQDYYRAHNCAWGLTAVLQYQIATGDMGYSDYAETCAQYIVDHELNIYDGTVWDQRLDAFVKGWCAGNLYLYGQATGNATFMDEAVLQGDDVLTWLNINPSLQLGLEYWAMSSGTAMWGVCNSVFREHPDIGQDWCGANAGYMDTWQEWYSVPGYDWDSAWNVAYANAHFAVWDVTGDQTYHGHGVASVDNLLSLDTDDDGGIRAETTDPDTEDMSWVSCYLIKFGLDRLLNGPPQHDTGVLRFVGLDGDELFEVDEPISIRLLLSNFGLADQTGVLLEFHDDELGSQSWTVDLTAASLDTFDVVLDWVPEQLGAHTLTASVGCTGDENTDNDALEITIHIGGMSAAPQLPGAIAGLGTRLSRNPFSNSTSFRFAMATAGKVQLEIFDVGGRLVTRIESDQLSTGEHRLQWTGTTADGREVPTGIYLYRLSDGRDHDQGKVVLLR